MEGGQRRQGKGRHHPLVGNTGDCRNQGCPIPYLPFSTADIGEMLGIGPEIEAWEAPVVPGGTALGEVRPVFAKLEEDSTRRLKPLGHHRWSNPV